MMKSVRLWFCVIAPVWVLCGLFSPRDITVTPAENSSGDPFSFRALLDSTGNEFSRYTWQDFFSPDCHYTNVTVAGTSWDRDDIVNHLQQLHDLKSHVKVSWVRNEEVVRDVDRIELNNVSYSVTDSTAADSVLYAGYCYFELVSDTSSVWRIRLWKDYTDNPFFSPEK